MAGLTQADAEAKLTEYMEAETAVLGNQSYSIGDRSMTRADLGDIRDGIKYWNRMVGELSGGAARVRLGTPI